MNVYKFSIIQGYSSYDSVDEIHELYDWFISQELMPYEWNVTRHIDPSTFEYIIDIIVWDNEVLALQFKLTYADKLI